MPNLTVALDFGSSLSRAFYVLSGKYEQPKLITFPPYSLTVEPSTIAAIKQHDLGIESTRPENNAWLSCHNQWYLVGELAKNQWCSEFSLEQRKLISAEPITLATIGAIAERHVLSSNLTASIGILLPWSEYEDRSFYERYISESLSSFQFQDTEYRVTVEQLRCLPEGAGLFARGRMVKNGLLPNIGEVNILVIMLGYRNSSLLFVERGNLSRGFTADFGMNWMVKRVKERTSGYKDEQLIEAISKAGNRVNQNALAPLVRNLPQRMRFDELKCLTEAISITRTEYVNLLKKWLQTKLNPRVDEVIISGGTFACFRKELVSEIKALTGCVPSSGQALEQRIIQLLGPKIRTHALHSRLADVYGFFYFLNGRRLPALNSGGVNERKKVS